MIKATKQMSGLLSSRFWDDITAAKDTNNELSALWVPARILTNF